MLGNRSPAAVRAAVRTLRFYSNYSGNNSSSRTLVSRFNFPRQPPSSSDAKTYLGTRNNDRNYRLSSIKLYSTILPSNASIAGDAAALECSSSSVENGGADAKSAESPRNGAMDEAYYAIELALDSVVKIFTVASSPRKTGHHPLSLSGSAVPPITMKNSVLHLLIR